MSVAYKILFNECKRIKIIIIFNHIMFSYLPDNKNQFIIIFFIFSYAEILIIPKFSIIHSFKFFPFCNFKSPFLSILRLTSLSLNI